MTHIVPIQKLRPIRHAIVRLPIGGIDVTRQLQKLLTPECTKLSADQLAKVKESHGHVSMQFEKDLAAAARNASFSQLEEGKVLSSLLFRSAEVLFQPAQAGIECLSLHEAVHAAISKCDASVRKQMYDNLVLSGGGSLLKGLPERLEKELLALSPPEHHAAIRKMHHAPERKWYSYFGANNFSTMPNFASDHVFSKAEYQEQGAAKLLARKCIN